MKEMLAFVLSYLATCAVIWAWAGYRVSTAPAVSHEREVRDFMRSVSAWEHSR